jgi:carbamoyltransferase
LFTWHQLLQRPRTAAVPDGQSGSFLGPEFTTSEIVAYLDSVGATYQPCADDAELFRSVVDLLVAGKIVGWFSGRMEFGPRALGARSILGDPRNVDMQSTMNLKIKFRESFRPFAPMVLQEHAADWFEIKPDEESPYMLIVAPVRKEHWTPLTDREVKLMESDPDLRRRVNVVRSRIPAVTHVDYSARLQTVDSLRNPRMHSLLTAFYERTGCPVLVNTSFNVRGEPIVRTPAEAHRCFLSTGMDALVLENCVLVKDATAPRVSDSERAAYLAQFQLD